MSNHKYTNYVCMAIITIAVLVTISLFYLRGSNAIEATTTEQPYVTQLFDTNKVHAIDIVISENDWTTLQENASKEEYVPCSVVIDGESVKNVAIRAKGNSSLQQVEQSDSERYSFKIEFDHYQDGNLYKGLDKLALNNIIQDATYMKDYLCYSMMAKMGVESPLCSYINVTVNGEAFGLYLAVEAVEDSFAERVYGTDHGLIYKPDSMDMNGGMGGDKNDNKMPQMPTTGEGGDGNVPQMPENMKDRAGGFGGTGSNDVALVYSDDEISSYTNIFDGAVFDVTNSDKKRLISSIKQMNEGTELEEVINIEEVLKYFVVHNFVLNFDSYTGSLMHNYYLYEKDGMLSMIPWDYNLAFGAFSMGNGQKGGPNNDHNATQNSDTTKSESTSQQGDSQATSMVNFPIDTPVSGTTMEERPLLNSLLSNETYRNQYHTYFDEFLKSYWENGTFTEEINRVKELIAPYVKTDTTAFYTYDEFETGVNTLLNFCDLRVESVRGQLDGIIPSTEEEQTTSESLVDGSTINLEDMGSNDMGKGNGPMGNPMSESDTTLQQNSEQGQTSDKEMPTFNGQNKEEFQEFNGKMPGNMTTSNAMGTQQWILFATCLICLLGGMVVIKRYGKW